MDFDNLIDELEEQGDDLVIMKPSQPFINQPSLLSINSINGEIQNSYDNTSYYSFIVNLPRPMLDVENLQLLSTNIPQANANIADTACAFWYYRLSAYSGLVPNPNNMYMVRLLPSFYKREFITNFANYGFNRTFKSYADLATELAKSCTKDLALTNYEIAQANSVPVPSLRIPFLPNDISLTYSSSANKFQFTGLPTAPVYQYWSVGTAYNTNDIVAYDNGIAYKALSAQTGNNPSTNPTFWTPLYNTEVVAEWDFATTYPAGRYVSYNNTLYRSIYQTIQFRPSGEIAEWVSGTQYFRGAAVSYLGNEYTCVNPNASVDAPSGSLNWTGLDWNIYAYKTGMVVREGASFYVASTNISSPTAPLPIPGSPWIFIGTNFWETTTLPNTEINVPCYNYLSTGFSDPAVKEIQSTGTQSWNEYNLYEAGEVVSYNGLYWTNARQSQGETPFSRTGATAWNGDTTEYVAGNVVVTGGIYYIATGYSFNVRPNAAFTPWRQENWTITSTAPPLVGLSAISKELDMITSSVYGDPPQTFYALQVPYDILPQPYSVNPKRLLNTILGFTWTGQIIPFIYASINQSDSTPIINPVYAREYNRLRPVPRYFVAGGAYLGSNALLTDSEDTFTYTAEGYCNLVYSSIISIYTSIAGTSTLDTQRDTNLLAIISMNCANLGVSFWNNFVDNPLTKVKGSIYSIYIELRDEFGDPYYLTNNAVSTFVFKVGYKEKS